MIKVTYKLDDDNNYTYLKSCGHANSDVQGKDLICASVSSIIFGFMNAIDGLEDNVKEKVEIQELDNEIIVINNSKSEIMNNYFELVLFQLKTIEESYSKFIKIERK